MSSHVCAHNSYNSSHLTLLSLLVVNIITTLWMTTWQSHGSRVGQPWLVNFAEVVLLQYKADTRTEHFFIKVAS